MKRKIFYSWELAEHKIDELYNNGIHFIVDIKFDNDDELEYCIISWE